MKEAVIILLMASTGMRIGALPGLRVGDLSTMTQRKDIYKIQVHARTKDSHYTFCTPECENAIDEYLYSFREAYGEAIQKDSPLIRETFDMGHKHSRGLNIHYDRTTEEDRLTGYVKAIPFLTIDPTQRLKQENAGLRKTQSDYLAELGELKEDFNEMKQLLVHLSKDSQKQLVNEFYQKVGDKTDIEWSCDD
jgi:uncharacterized protein (UPF0262 family)